MEVAAHTPTKGMDSHNQKEEEDGGQILAQKSGQRAKFASEMLRAEIPSPVCQQCA